MTISLRDRHPGCADLEKAPVHSPRVDLASRVLATYLPACGSSIPSPDAVHRQTPEPEARRRPCRPARRGSEPWTDRSWARRPSLRDC
ncbi:hypothetical protein MYVA_4631 [Mycolicibacterium vaccae 95051]|nr:hypothetical protein MYVA_4631 [Mycolicibacterium vaccae 95051]